LGRGNNCYFKLFQGKFWDFDRPKIRFNPINPGFRGHQVLAGVVVKW
jgi:hypothetical protein